MRAFLAVSLVVLLASCTFEEQSQEISADNSSNESTGGVQEIETGQAEGDATGPAEDESSEIKPPTENQFDQNLKALQYQYDAALGADVYFPQAGGTLPDGVGIGLQLIFVDYDQYHLQLRVIKQPTGEFGIQSLELSADGQQIDFAFNSAQLYDAYIYDELTYEIAEYRLSDEEVEFFFDLLDSDESTWKLTGSSENLESGFDKLSILGIGTVLRFKQGLDEGYEIPEGLAKPLM